MKPTKVQHTNITASHVSQQRYCQQHSQGSYQIRCSIKYHKASKYHRGVSQHHHKVSQYRYCEPVEYHNVQEYHKVSQQQQSANLYQIRCSIKNHGYHSRDIVSSKVSQSITAAAEWGLYQIRCSIKYHGYHSSISAAILWPSRVSQEYHSREPAADRWFVSNQMQHKVPWISQQYHKVSQQRTSSKLLVCIKSNAA